MFQLLLLLLLFTFSVRRPRASMRERLCSGTQLDGTVVVVAAVVAVAGVLAVLVIVHLLLVLLLLRWRCAVLLSLC